VYACRQNNTQEIDARFCLRAHINAKILCHSEYPKFTSNKCETEESFKTFLLIKNIFGIKGSLELSQEP